MASLPRSVAQLATLVGLDGARLVEEVGLSLEVLNDPHLHARGFLKLTDTETGPVALPNSPMRYIGSDLRQLTPPPGLGEHTDAALSELCGLDAAELATLRAEGVIGG